MLTQMVLQSLPLMQNLLKRPHDSDVQFAMKQECQMQVVIQECK